MKLKWGFLSPTTEDSFESLERQNSHIEFTFSLSWDLHEFVLLNYMRSCLRFLLHLAFYGLLSRHESSTFSGKFHLFVVKMLKVEWQTTCKAYVPLVNLSPLIRSCWEIRVHLDTNVDQGFHFPPCNIYQSTPKSATLLAGSKPSYYQPHFHNGWKGDNAVVHQCLSHCVAPSNHLGGLARGLELSNYYVAGICGGREWCIFGARPRASLVLIHFCPGLFLYGSVGV